MGHEFESLSGLVIEAALDVHRELGPGFLESVYESTLCVALRQRGIVYEAQKETTVFFASEEVGTHRLDLLVESDLIVELKAVKALEDIHYAQLRSYLKATRCSVGLLLNFNAPKLVIKRVVFTHH